MLDKLIDLNYTGFIFSFLFLIQVHSFAQNETYIFPKIKSNVTVPISISVPEITNLINSSVKGVLYEDKSFTDNKNDQFKVKVEKSGDIKLVTLTNNRFLIEIPLKIWAQKGFGTLGLYTYQETNFNLVMKFITSINLNTNWTLLTNTRSYGYEWTVEPVLDYGRVKIPIASLIESTLDEQQMNFTAIIDQQIQESFDLKPYLLQVWNQFSIPINISEDYDTWLKLTPQTVYCSPLKMFKDVIKVSVGLDLFSETYLGEIPATTPLLVNFPNYKFKEEIPTDFHLKTTANVSFANANKIAKQQFLNKEFELNGEKNKVKVTDISVYPEDGLVVIEAHTSGAVNGISYIKGIPIYDLVSHKIILKNIDFNLKTKNIFHKALTTLFEGKIRKLIEKEYGIPLLEIEITAKKSLEENFNKEYYPGIFLKGNVKNLTPTQILVFKDFMTVVIDTNANLQLNVKGLNF